MNKKYEEFLKELILISSTNLAYIQEMHDGDVTSLIFSLKYPKELAQVQELINNFDFMKNDIHTTYPEGK